MGSVGEAIFFASLCLLGVICLVAILTSVRVAAWPGRQYFPELYFRETTCILRDARLSLQSDASDRSGYRAELLVECDQEHLLPSQWVPISDYSRNRDAQLAILDRYEIGGTYPCWYPSDASGPLVLRQPSHLRLWLLLLVLVSFILIGVGGVTYTALNAGTSAERRAALAKSAAKNIDLIRDSDPPEVFPNIPHDANLKNSPGVDLAYRLPAAHTGAWRLFAGALFCVIWSGITTVFVVMAASGHAVGRPEWLLTLVSLPFLAITAWSIYVFLRQLLRMTGIGPTSIEVSDHPLYPGRSYRMSLSQTGRLSIQAFKLLLVCEEETTYIQGTDLRTDRRRVHQHIVAIKDHAEVKPGSPLVLNCPLEIPAGAMHSFQSVHNSVVWSLLVTGKVHGWAPDQQFERSFPVLVYPQPDGKPPGTVHGIQH